MTKDVFFCAPFILLRGMCVGVGGWGGPYKNSRDPPWERVFHIFNFAILYPFWLKRMWACGPRLGLSI